LIREVTRRVAKNTFLSAEDERQFFVVSFLGSVDILGRLFRFQQELKACRPVRDVSRFTVEIDKTI